MADQNSALRMYADIDPRVELVEGERFHTLLIYVPGFKKKELKIHKVQDNTSWNLKVTGNRQLEGNNWLRFEKNFPVPKECEINHIKAKIDNGVLYLVMPKFPVLDQTPSQVSSKPIGGVLSTLLQGKHVILTVAIFAAILLALILFRYKLADGDTTTPH